MISYYTIVYFVVSHYPILPHLHVIFPYLIFAYLTLSCLILSYAILLYTLWYFMLYYLVSYLLLYDLISYVFILYPKQLPLTILLGKLFLFGNLSSLALLACSCLCDYSAQPTDHRKSKLFWPTGRGCLTRHRDQFSCPMMRYDDFSQYPHYPHKHEEICTM